jgi:hypothetical protein
MYAQVVRENFRETLVLRWTRKVVASRRSARALAITHSMLALCSAAYKALRFASTALTRGLRALTPPARSSGTGNYMMAVRSCQDAPNVSGPKPPTSAATRSSPD